jgi:hypothetical protein
LQFSAIDFTEKDDAPLSYSLYSRDISKNLKLRRKIMNCPLANRLFLPVLVSGLAVLATSCQKSEQNPSAPLSLESTSLSANPCAQYIPNLQNGDYNTYYQCALEWTKKAGQQSQPNSPPQYTPNSEVYSRQQQLIQQTYDMKRKSLQDTACMPYCNKN